MADTTLNEYIGKRVFFVGIGGCSMSGLAKMLKWLGCEVAGSDRTRSHKTDALAQDGIEIMRILDAVYESARTGHEVVLG